MILPFMTKNNSPWGEAILNLKGLPFKTFGFAGNNSIFTWSKDKVRVEDVVVVFLVVEILLGLDK